MKVDIAVPAGNRGKIKERTKEINIWTLPED